MLTQNEISKLNKCLLNDHLILEVEMNVITKEGLNLRNRLNSGDVLTNSELMALPYSESLAQVKITDKDDLHWFTAYSIANGRDFQSLFETDKFEYLSLFIDNENVSLQFKEKLKTYGLQDNFQSNGATTITVSFPEKSKTNVVVNKYQWPDGNNMTVNCPNCGSAIEVQSSGVKEIGLPLTLNVDEGDIYRLARDVSDQLSIIINSVEKDNAKEVIAVAAGEIQWLVQNSCEEKGN